MAIDFFLAGVTDDEMRIVQEKMESINTNERYKK
jgi:hypothetical protein